MSKLVNEHCPLGNKPCRFCSDEINKTVRPACDRFTKKMIMIRKRIPLGLYCNTHEIGITGWIDQMTSLNIACPLIEGNKAPLVIRPPDELSWSKKH